MGKFSHNKSNPPKEQEKDTKTTRGVVVILLDFITSIVLMLEKAVLDLITWILKKVFTQYFDTLSQLLDIRGLEKAVAKKRVTIALIILCIFPGVPLFLIYKIPFVRDAISLSTSVEVNIQLAGRQLYYPNRTYFEKTVTIEKYDFTQYGAPGIYLSYNGYGKEKYQVTPHGSCPLIPREVVVMLASLYAPFAAEGFKDRVSYLIEIPLEDLSGFDYIMQFLKHPQYLATNSDTRSATMVRLNRKESWKRMLQEWQHIVVIKDGLKGLIIESNNNEHAIICF